MEVKKKLFMLSAGNFEEKEAEELEMSISSFVDFDINHWYKFDFKFNYKLFQYSFSSLATTMGTTSQDSASASKNKLI